MAEEEKKENVEQNDAEQGATEAVETSGTAEEISQDKEEKKSFFGKKKENNELKKLQEEIENQKKANDELKDKYLRLAADFDNFKRRTAKENETKYLDTKADTLAVILPIIDNFERALKVSVPEESQAYTKGYEMIYTILKDILTKNNIEEIPSMGEQFDVNLHHAVMHVDDETVGENTIVEVFEKGYKMGDRVLRCSMVKVAN